MPIEIPAGETFNFDVAVNVGLPGDSEMDFNLFVESENRLYIEQIKYPLLVVESGRTQPDWIKPTEDPTVAAKSAENDQPTGSSETAPDRE